MEGMHLSDGISESMKAFIQKNFRSVTQIEILLLLYRQKDQKWTAESLSNILRLSPSSVFTNLKNLEESGLIFLTSESGQTFFRESSAPETVSALETLTTLYKTHRVKIVELIYSTLQ